MGERLKDKTAVVVGAGQTPGETIGNGRAMAILFAREGARVLCVDRVLERAEETAAMIAAEGGEASAFEADVTDAAQAASIIETGKARLGRIDILVNNVGIGGSAGGRDGPAQHADEPAFDKILEVNLKGQWLVSKAVIPVMREAGGGAIVNISSLASLSGGNQIAYEVSKAGVNRLTTSVAAANAKYRVRCNAVLPGLMDTPMAVGGIARGSGRSTDEVRAARNARVPMGEMGTAWDTANAALFLASDEARFITGVLLVVDGGMHVGERGKTMSATDRIREALTSGMAEAGLPGLVAAARLPDGERVEVALGVRGVGNPAPMTADTLFWVASCTKALTSAAALQLVEEGLIELDDPVGRWLPPLAAPMVLKGFDANEKPILEPAGEPITLRRLLAHTSGLGYPFCSATLARYIAAAGVTQSPITPPDLPLLFEPGQGWQYSIGIDWVGRLIEAVTGESFDDALRRRVLAPLGMDDTGFFLSEGQRARLASMHARTPDGGLAPIPFAMPFEPHFGMGGGGLYSNPGQYLRFLDSMLGRGPQLLKSDHFGLFCERQVEGPDIGVLTSAQPPTSNTFDPFPGMAKAWTLGFVSNLEPGPNGRSAGSLAWAGLSNCYYWIDRESGAAGVMCAQFLPFADPRALAAFGAFERAVYAF